MPPTTRQTNCACHFEMRYEHISHPAMQALERGVLGCNYGGTSWTTKSQAEEIPGLLGLQAGERLLDIGSGTGWPGLYMASLTGASVTLLDLPIHALSQANERAVADQICASVKSVAASGAALPFTAGTFAAIEHSDVLCCLPEKTDMLEECRRVATEGALMLFYVIAPTPGLSAAEQDLAIEAGPPFVEMPDNYARLLDRSGWDVLETKDLTTDYLTATRKLLAGLEKDAGTLARVMGDEIYAEQLTRRRLQISAIERGLLVRELFLVQTI